MSESAALNELPPLREVIAVHGLSARKGLGQNFILDLNLTRRIAREAGPFSNGAVYEVGPGPGGLTRALLSESTARVFAVERDTRCLAALAEISAAAPGRLAVENADALELDEAALFAAHGIDTPIAVVANLPFNVGTALLVKWLTVAIWPPWWARLTLMFQAEVAARITAEAGDEDYGRLAVLAQWRCTARKLFDVSRRVFVPIPNVDAAIVRIDPLPAPRFPAALRDLEAVTAAAFGQRRKMLRQSLKSISPDVNELLGLAGIDGAARPETLSIEQFCALARARAAILAGSIRPSVS